MRTIYVGDTVYQKTETGFNAFAVKEVIDQTTVLVEEDGSDVRLEEFLTLSEVFRIYGKDAFEDALLDAGVDEADLPTFTTEEIREIDEDNNPAESQFMQENAPEAIENETVPEITVTEEAFEETPSATTEEEVKPAEDLTDLTKLIESTVAAPVEETLPAKSPATKKASTKKKK